MYFLQDASLMTTELEHRNSLEQMEDTLKMLVSQQLPPGVKTSSVSRQQAVVAEAGKGQCC